MTNPNGAAEGTPFVAPSLLQAALKGLCPRCGCPSLFAGAIRFAPRCSACGLDFDRYNVGDGPAAFLTLVIGTIVVALAIWLELAVGPPLWVHMAIWIPVTAAGVVGSLRFAKAALMAAEVRNAAREGRIRPTGDLSA
ncbi:DUF983 domain-containing protein [Sphingomonas rubra]|uniref:Uncharacterized conserved protein, DUF983 family n=1 Tax=Sphingomonas rubra TaxID=634430 RepID=A0A1I5T3L6_9SPHN|nr:DUF983 domain-containing protein [Sphingomonas rubra]SFP77635.1 Uncharacterized conserved protein, DUF983 family [Sphingomonas rubra]